MSARKAMTAESWRIGRTVGASFVLAVLIHLLTISWLAGTYVKQVQSNTEDIQRLEEKQEECLEMKTDIATIKSDVGWIKRALDKGEK